jgi:RimJ/RimL family protein N-acetyltransferase
LRASRLALEPLIAEHAEVLFPLLADDELWRYTDERRPETVKALRDRYRRLESRRSGARGELWLNWAVAVPEYGVIGFVQATVFEQLGQAQIAYVIAQRFWSLGFGTEAVGAVVTFVRETLRVKHITATVDARNAASLQLLRKLGFQTVDANDPCNLQLALPIDE